MMGKLVRLSAVLAVSASLALAGCGTGVQENANDDEAAVETEEQPADEYASDMDDTTECGLYWLSMDVPNSWATSRSDDGDTITFTPSFGGLVQVSCSGGIDFQDNGSEEVDVLLDSLDGDVTQVVSEKVAGNLGDAVTYKADTERTEGDELYKGSAYFIISGHSLYMFLSAFPEYVYDGGYDEVYEEFLSSATLGEAYPPMGSDASSGTGAVEDDGEGATGSDASYGDGKYKVGQDIPAGEYKLTANAGTSGYWEVNDSSSPDADIVGNEVFDGSTYVTVSDGQYLTLNRCTAVAV